MKNKIKQRDSLSKKCACSNDLIYNSNVSIGLITHIEPNLYKAGKRKVLSVKGFSIWLFSGFSFLILK